MNRKIPQHRQEDHGNQLKEQTHSSDHCDEPEKTRVKNFRKN